MATTGITELEIEAAIEKILTVDETAPADPLGVADATDTYRKVIEIVTSLLTADPWSVFYLTHLVKNRVNQDLDAALGYAQDILVALGEVGARPTPVTGTSLLADAEGALSSMDGLAGGRDTLSSTALATYSQAVDSFVDKSISPNVKKATGLASPAAYEIARPPQEAREAVQNSLKYLIDLHPALLLEVVQLQGVLGEFGDLDLAARAARTAIRRVWITHHKLKESYAADTAYTAVGRSRSAYLDLITGKTILQSLAARSDPLQPKMQAVTADTIRMAAYSPASTSTAASLVAPKSGPYRVVPGSSDQLKFSVDGAADQTVTLGASVAAVIKGAEEGYFDIHAEQKARLSSGAGPYVVPASPNNAMKIYVDGECYSGVLTPGPMTASLLETALKGLTNLGGWPLNGAGVTFSVVADVVIIDYATGGDHEISVGDHATLNTA